jgi:hypothetical protein
MEKICEHCNDLFIVKRKNVVYCSASCRQMAYIDRRFNSVMNNETVGTLTGIPLSDMPNTKPSIDGSRNNAETSIDTSQKNEEPAIDGSQINSTNPHHQQIDSEDETQHHAHESTLQHLTQAPIEAYKDINSKFLTAIADLSNRRDYLSILNNCLYVHKNVPSHNIGMKLKCLVECLLLFSEMSLTDLDDLKEVCNAFTLTINSDYYKQLPDRFPYKSYILSLRNKLKQLIVENRNDEKIQFRLSPDNKIELMATRFELSHFYTKKTFCDVNFSE